MRPFVLGAIAALLFAGTLLSQPAIAQQTITVDDDQSITFSEATLPGPILWDTDFSSQDIRQLLSDEERQRLAPDLQRALAAQRHDPGWQVSAEATDHPSISGKEPAEALVHLIVYTDNPSALDIPGVETGAAFSDFVTARVPLHQLSELAANHNVSYAKVAQTHEIDHVESIADTRAHLLHNGVLDNTEYLGKGAAVCIVDTGIDFRHEDFIDDDGESRIITLWDQRLDRESGERAPSGFTNGVEYNQDDLTAAIQAGIRGNVRHIDDSGHGTHVAGSAAGNGRAQHGTFRGMAPLADMYVVNVTAEGGSGTSTTNLIDGVDYCFRKADEHGVPMAVNVSFGNTQGPKDGTEPFSRAVDELTAGETGRLVTVSAGNAGNNNMHTSAQLTPGDTATVEFDIPDISADGQSGNWVHLDGWHSTDSGISVELISPPVFDSNDDGSPDSSMVIELHPGDIEDRTHFNLGTVQAEHTAPGAMGGGDLNTDIRIRPTRRGSGPASGRWQLRMYNYSAEPHTFHGWLRTSGDLSDASLVHGDNFYTLNRNATGHHSMTVGNYTVRHRWYSENGSHYRFGGMEPNRVSPSSSKGPTRDDRLGLDLIAPGSGIAAPLSRDATGSRPSSRMLPGRNYLILTGTSMSAPHAAGGAALLFAEDPSLTSDEVHRLLTESTRQDEFTADERIAGHGKMDVYNAMMQLRHSNPGTVSYLHYMESTTTSTRIGNRPHAVRFTPETDGLITNLYLQTSREEDHRPAIDGEGDLLYLLYSDSGGSPDRPITDTLRTPLDALIPQARISFDMWKAINTDLNVSAGNSYHLVFFTEDEDASVHVEAGTPASDPRSSVATGSNASSWQTLQDDLQVDTPLELNAMAELTSKTDNIILPVKLLSFDYTRQGQRVQLHWETGGEQNNEGFVIEHAFEDEPFEQIAFVEGLGTTDTHESYSYETNRLNIGIHRFRLQQQNFDGTFFTTREMRVRVAIDGTHLIGSPYPNPSINNAQFDVSVADDQRVTARVFDMLGREVDLVLDEDLEAETTHTFPLDTYRLASGQYVLYIEGEMFTEREVFTVVR